MTFGLGFAATALALGIAGCVPDSPRKSTSPARAALSEAALPAADVPAPTKGSSTAGKGEIASGTAAAPIAGNSSASGRD